MGLFYLVLMAKWKDLYHVHLLTVIYSSVTCDTVTYNTSAAITILRQLLISTAPK